MKQSLSDILVLMVGSIVIAALSILFIWTNQIKESGSGRILGFITYRYHVAEKKSTSGVIWQNVHQSEDVRNRDWIRTGKNSEATVHLENEAMINLEPLTMIVLSYDEEKRPEINIQSGAIFIDNEEAVPVRIKSGNERIEMQSGKAKIVSTKKGLNIQSTDSPVSFSYNDRAYETPPAATFVIENNQSLLTENRPELLEPQNDRIVLLEQSETATVILKWKNLTESSGLYTVEISNNPAFVEPSISKTVRNTNYTFTGEKGIYYWRVLSQDNHSSVINRFQIESARRPQTVFPVKHSMLRYVNEPPPVLLQWTETPGAIYYNVKVYNKENPENPVFDRDANSNHITVYLPEGSYVWRVKASGERKGLFGESEISNFSVRKSAELPPPLITYPAHGEKISEQEDGGVLFTWSPDREIEKSEILIAKDKSFKTIVERKIIRSNSAHIDIKEDSQYFWKVRGFDINEKPTTYSLTGYFSYISMVKEPNITDAGESEGKEETELPVKEEEKSVTVKKTETATPAQEPVKPSGPIAAPVPVNPAPGQTIDMSNSDQIVFRWKAVAEAVSYRFALYRNGKNIFTKDINTTNYTFTELTILDEGKFQWSVESISADGNRDSEPSAKIEFIITLEDAPEAPTEIDTQ